MVINEINTTLTCIITSNRPWAKTYDKLSDLSVLSGSWQNVPQQRIIQE
jgi:hypothetical protein